jgi:hypothetical protein
MDKDAVWSVIKSIAATIIVTVLLIYGVDWLNLILTGEYIINPWEITLFLLRPEVLLATAIIVVVLAIFMLKSLSE